MTYDFTQLQYSAVIKWHVHATHTEYVTVTPGENEMEVLGAPVTVPCFVLEYWSTIQSAAPKLYSIAILPVLLPTVNGMSSSSNRIVCPYVAPTVTPFIPHPSTFLPMDLIAKSWITRCSEQKRVDHSDADVVLPVGVGERQRERSTDDDDISLLSRCLSSPNEIIQLVAFSKIVSVASVPRSQFGDKLCGARL
jgi:hypothetical protein